MAQLVEQLTLNQKPAFQIPASNQGKCFAVCVSIRLALGWVGAGWGGFGWLPVTIWSQAADCLVTALRPLPGHGFDPGAWSRL